ncbi:MAG: hypothetical protein ACP5FR_01845 [Candidatus Micrarchaeia archaeon]
MEEDYKQGSQQVPSYTPTSGDIYVPSPDSSEQGNQESAKVPKSKRNLGAAPKILMAVLLLVVISYGAFYIIHSKGIPQIKTFTTSSNKLVSMLSAGKPINISNLSSAISSQVNKTARLNVSYSGYAQLTAKSKTMGNMSERMPLNISYEKFYNTSRFAINIANAPLFGNISIVEIANGSTKYSCSSMRSFPLSSNNTGYQCEKNSNQETQTVPVSSATNITQEQGIMLHGVKQLSSNNGQCYLVHGSGIMKNIMQAPQASQYQQQTAQNVSYNITTCILTDQGIPLNLTAQIVLGNETAPLTVGIYLDLKSISNNTSADIAVLPGPLESLNGSASAPIGYPSQQNYTQGNITNESKYEYSGIYNGTVVVLTPPTYPVGNIEGMQIVGQLQNFYTTNPSYQCLDGDSMNVYAGKYANQYIVDNEFEGQCANIALSFG